MLVALGFLIASLLGLLVASAFWSRAVRLTTKRLRQSMPVSEPEIKADRDRLKAEHAIKIHKLTTQLEQAQLERARHQIEINRRDATISALETGVSTIRTELEENLNARRVLEQTVADRLPKVEARLAEAKRLLFNRDREIAELAQGAKRHKLALEEASSLNAQKAAQIDRLNTALSRRGDRGRRPESEGEAALRAELEGLRTKAREQAALIDRLQQRLGHGFDGPMSAPLTSAADLEPLDQDGEAGVAPAAATSSRPEDASKADRETRALKARIEDQTGEIARLKAALTAFEQAEGTRRGLKNSKLALRARADSAEAQSERQAATINKLRAELAATHERLARQAAHFMDEMRRVGAAPSAAKPQRPDREGRRRNLLDRVAQVRPALKGEADAAKQDVQAPPAPADHAAIAAGNGHSGNGGGHSPEEEAVPPAPQMPQTPKIEERPRLRLLDRITGLAKN
jgi:chromosome segregation ATPase